MPLVNPGSAAIDVTAIASNLVPSADNTRELGGFGPDKRWIFNLGDGFFAYADIKTSAGALFGSVGYGTAYSVDALLDGYQSVGVGANTYGAGLKSIKPALIQTTNGLVIQTTGTKPAAAVGVRGMLWITLGGAGVADTVEICTKDSANAYGWRTLI